MARVWASFPIFCCKKASYEVSLIDIDTESYEFLQKKYPQLGKRLINADFLEMDFAAFFNGPMALLVIFLIIFHRKYLFKVLDNRQQVVEVVGMFQKEVAERCTSKPAVKNMAF